LSDLSREFLASLSATPVAGSVIAAALGTKESVSLAQSRYARDLSPPHLVERHSAKGEIRYGLRPTKPGELAGQVKEAELR